MVDTETFGTRPGCAIRSLGACVFSLDGTLGAEFYANIDHVSCIEVGLHVDPDTQKWWAKQTKEAQDSLLVDSRPLRQVLSAFTAWFTQNNGTKIWSQGANFDEPIVSAAYHACNMKAPWKYWGARDTRTLYDIFKLDPRTVTRAGTYHNALDDARYQVRCCQIAYARGMKPPMIKNGIGLPEPAIKPGAVIIAPVTGGFLENKSIVTGKVMPWE